MTSAAGACLQPVAFCPHHSGEKSPLPWFSALARMGAIAAELSDLAIVTSDNPRSEDPDAIIAEIVAGVDDRAGVEVDADRRAAIRRAIELAEPGDVLVIAGKGHEQGQEFAGGRKEPFDDVAVAREALRATRAGA